MLIANVADIHARGKDLEACRSQLAAMVAECVRREVSLVTFAGDIFDKSSIQDQHASTGAIAAVVIGAVAELTKHGIEVLMIPGDHDQAGSGSADALHVFDGMAGVMVERYVEWVDFPNFSVFCVPWFWSGLDPSGYINVAKDRIGRPPRQNMLLAHIRIGGAILSGTQTCEEVNKSATRTWQVPRAFLESLPFDHFALGNFHKRQDLTGGRGGFIGALRQNDFGFEGDPAGFETWDSETGATEWVELDAAPTYRTLEIGSGQMPPEKPEGNERLKIRYTCGGIIGGNEAVSRLEAAGMEVEHIIDREERTQRAEVPEGIIHKPHELIDLWVGTQTPPIEGERLAAMHEMHDKVNADEEVTT